MNEGRFGPQPDGRTPTPMPRPKPRHRRAGRMRFLRWLLPAATLLAGVVAMVPNASAATVEGIDVSHWQGSINWSAVRASGIEFAYIKATEGTSFRDASFNAN